MSEYFSKPEVPLAETDIIAVIALRNEKARLPYFFEYYRRLGVSKFFVVDNNSSDGSADYLKSQNDVVYFWTDGSYKDSAAGRYWTHELAAHYGQGRWCLTLDVDELYVYPLYEVVSLADYAQYHESIGARTSFGVFLDMYSDRPLSQTYYTAGAPFFQTCPYFDADDYDLTPSENFPAPQIFGGPRRRQFWESGEKGNGPSQRKHVFVKWSPDFYYVHSTHSMSPLPLSDTTTAVLHFKFFSSFIALAEVENKRGDRVQAAHYQNYFETISQNEDITFMTERSQRFEGSLSLYKAGYIAVSDRYLDFVEARLAQLDPQRRLEGAKLLAAFRQGERPPLPLRNLRDVWPLLKHHGDAGMRARELSVGQRVSGTDGDDEQSDKHRPISVLRGAVTFAHESGVGGWVADDLGPARQFRVTIKAGSRVIGVTTTGKPSTVAGRNLPHKGLCAFVLPLSSWTARSLSGREITASIEPSIKLGAFTYIAGAKSSEAAGLAGAVDKIDLETRSVRGWAWDRNNPDKAFWITVFWDDARLFDVKASKVQRFRLQAAKDPRIASHGLNFVLPRDLFDGKKHCLTLRFRWTGVVLNHTPVVIDTEARTAERV